MFYREVTPDDGLTGYVLSFWEVRGPDRFPASVSHDIFPDGCVSLYFFRNQLSGRVDTGVVPVQTRSSTRTVTASDVFWGVRFQPSAAAALLRGDPRCLQNGSMNVSHLKAGLCESMADAESLEDAIPIFSKRLNELITSGPMKPDLIVAKAVDRMIEYGGEIKIGQLAASLDLSPRQLQRRFRASAGISPKQFARIRRLRATAAFLLSKDPISWADCAAEMGFADQAHMNKEFSEVTSSSPRVFAKKLRSIEHGSY